MRYYIECFYVDGTQILGNLDGQTSMDCRDFRRTNAFKRVKRIVGNPNHMGGKLRLLALSMHQVKSMHVLVTRCIGSRSKMVQSVGSSLRQGCFEALA